jgi:hypothetical protein
MDQCATTWITQSHFGLETSLLPCVTQRSCSIMPQNAAYRSLARSGRGFTPFSILSVASLRAVVSAAWSPRQAVRAQRELSVVDWSERAGGSHGPCRADR